MRYVIKVNALGKDYYLMPHFHMDEEKKQSVFSSGIEDAKIFLNIVHAERWKEIMELDENFKCVPYEE